MVNLRMWRQALWVIPRTTREEWGELDLFSRWLVASRAAVFVMTFFSAAMAGLFAQLQGRFHLGRWLLVTTGLVLAHATNNLVNDFVDFIKGVDRDNYARTQYGPQTLESGFLSKRQMMVYILVTGLLASSLGLVLAWQGGREVWLLMSAGAFFVLFYTWPLKHVGMGEPAVLLVWGPLMIGGGYRVITGSWDSNVIIASLPYAISVTTVLMGKHIDKISDDRAKGIRTLPVLLGEKVSRYAVLGLMIAQYVLVIYLVSARFLSPILLLVLFGLRRLWQVQSVLRRPKPSAPPADYPGNWPLWFVAHTFVHNRRFGALFMVALLAEVVARSLPG